jgi:hypothetical protein
VTVLLTRRLVARRTAGGEGVSTGIRSVNQAERGKPHLPRDNTVSGSQVKGTAEGVGEVGGSERPAVMAGIGLRLA